MMRFDLRPPEYRQQGNQKKKKGPEGIRFLFLILLFLFIGASLLSVGYSYLFLREQQADLRARQQSLKVLERQAKALNTELQRLQAEEKEYQSILGLLKAELPSLEVLAALEGSLPPRVWLTSINIAKNAVSMQGLAFSEADVVEFGNNLAEASIIKSVVVPKVSRSREGTSKTVSFVLDCSLHDITAVTLAKEDS
ncbi:MAG TPA: PilN domain-containing protein [Synergistaceae bacterium]|nr:PilN domain-containing protein [Synergistaceae bacterium]HPJ26924.1 PilN domain-containing protein [Synergistaceae bacterium]